MNRFMFNLTYKAIPCEPLNLDKPLNVITYEDLKRIGMQTDPRQNKEKCFAIEKCEADGFLSWRLTNEGAKDLYINSRKNPSDSSETLVRRGESYKFKNLSDEKIYFNKNNQMWDYLKFNKTKMMVSKTPSKKKDDDFPFQITFDDLQSLFEGNQDSQEKLICEFPLGSSQPSINEGNSINNLTSQNKDEEEEEEKQRNNLFMEGYLDDLLKQYDEYDKANNGKKSPTLIQENEFISKTNLNSNANLNKAPKEKEKEISKKSKIIMDEEEESQQQQKEKQKEEEEEDYFTESVINSLYDMYRKEDYMNQFKQPNSNKQETKVSYNFQSLSPSKRKEEYQNSLSKLTGEKFNSQGKRIRRQSGSSNKEFDDFLSGFKTKRLKKATDNKELKIDLNTTCAICLDNIIQLANLDNCSHDFCKPCILEWSKNTNVCPLCKKEFKKIIYYEKNKKKELKVKRRKLEVDEGFELYDEVAVESSDNCLKCGRGDDFSNMLVCDGCRYNVCHTYCDGLSSIPENDWYCEDCRRNDNANIIRDFIRREINASEEDDEDYEPRVLLEEEDDQIAEENEACDSFDDVIILSDDNNRARRRPNRANNNGNISFNIRVNLNVPDRIVSRRSSNTSSLGSNNNISNNISNANTRSSHVLRRRNRNNN